MRAARPSALAAAGVQLDRPCPDCDGRGTVYDEELEREGGCVECDCTGFQLTAEGSAVVALVRRHLGYNLRAVRRHEDRYHR